LLGACAGTGDPPEPQLAAQWMRTSPAFARSERLGPPIAARISAYGSLALYEKPGSEFWKMGKEFSDSVRSLTPDKKQIALFRADNPVAMGTRGFHRTSVDNQMVTRRHLSADEVAISRVHGGIHFVRAVTLGLVQGECIGTRALERLMTRRGT
jgi:hypothetical protein